MSSVSTLSTSAAPAMGGRLPAESPEEAARQFEAVLVRQFVEVMTKDLFDGEGEGGLTGQADLQRETLTDTLTSHLVESGTFGVADLMIAQWKRSGRIPSDPPEATPAEAPLGTPSAARRPLATALDGRPPMTLEEALRLHPLSESTAPAQGRPRSSDHPQDPIP